MKQQLNGKYSTDDQEQIRVIGEKIKEFRKLRDWNAEELARQSGVSRAAIHRYESAVSCPNYTALLKISKAFGMTLPDFISKKIVIVYVVEAGPVQS